MRRWGVFLVAAAAMLAVAALLSPVAYAGAPPPGAPPPLFGRGADHAVFVQTERPGRQPGRRLQPSRERHLDRGEHVRDRGTGRGAERLGRRSPRLSGIARVRPAPRAALRGECGQQHGVGLLGSRQPSQPEPGAELGRNLPGQRGRTRRPRLRAECRERRERAGVRCSAGPPVPLPGSNRPLGLNPAATPQFTNTPGQVAFSPDGDELIVTTKANGNDIDVFGVGFLGYLSAGPVVNSEPGTVPSRSASTVRASSSSPRRAPTRWRRSSSTETERSLRSPPFRPARQRRAGLPLSMGSSMRPTREAPR